MNLTLTQSELKTFMRCRRRWWLGSFRRLQKRDEYKSALSVGTLVHDALDHYYAGETDPVRVITDAGMRLVEERPDLEQDIAKDVDLARIMIEGYLAWVEEEGVDYDFKVVEPERTLKVQLDVGGPTGAVELWGKLDARVEKRDGWTAFLETKTTGNFVDLPATAQIDFQLLTYGVLDYMDHLAKQPDDRALRTDGVILNLLRKVKRTAAAKPPFYKRVEVRHNVQQLRSHWLHVVALAREIADSRRRLEAGESHHTVVPPTPAIDCRYTCSFFAACPLFDDGSDVEAVLELEYEEHDPLARYQKEETS